MHTYVLTYIQRKKERNKETEDSRNKETGEQRDRGTKRQVSFHGHLQAPHLPKGPFLQAFFIGVALDSGPGVPETYWKNTLGLTGVESHGGE